MGGKDDLGIPTIGRSMEQPKKRPSQKWMKPRLKLIHNQNTAFGEGVEKGTSHGDKFFGSLGLPQRVKAKAKWLRLTPNALVVACLRDCLEAMDDPKKALVPPPIVVEFWTVSHAKLRPEPDGVIQAMILETYEAILRKRSGPILDTIIRLALSEKWDASLEQILRDADVITKDREMKSRLGPIRLR
jgi:hypothetical protein